MGARSLFALVLMALAVGAFLSLRESPQRGREGPSPGQASAASSAAVLAASGSAEVTPAPDAAPSARTPSSTGTTEAPTAAPRGGWLRGRLLSAEGVSWSDYRIGIETEAPASGRPAERMRQLRLERVPVRAIASDGRFELGPVRAGLATVYLHLSEAALWRGTGHGEAVTNRQGLGQVTIEEGRVTERDFEVAELPGSFSIEVRLNGAPAGGLGVVVRRDLGGSVEGRTDEHGRFGPLPVLAGALWVYVSHPQVGWKHAHPAPIVVDTSARLYAVVAIEVASARLSFTDRESGAPLAGRRIALLSAEGLVLSSSSVTDGGGSATFALPPGTYRFAASTGDGEGFELESMRRSEPVRWTAQGPRVDSVSL